MSGGNSTGGSSTGGSSTGGSSTGGSSNGGSSNGGSSNGGGSNGGTATGGSMSGGSSNGGTATGGTTTGGTNAGGTGGQAAGGGGGRGGALDCDRDDDGHLATVTGCAGLDCDDADGDAHPGQQGFFETARASGGFDYDCNGRSEQQFSNTLDCSLLSLANCSGEGFSGSLPACGATGTWIRCVPTLPPLSLICTSETVSTRRMPCR